MANKPIAIIPARGGSKRIPHKNIIEFLGKPLIAWTIEEAFKSELFDHVVVSTDDTEIAEVAKKYGAEVPFLRTVATDDKSGVGEATLASLIQAEEYYQKQFPAVVQLFAVCPLRSYDEITASYKHFMDQQLEFLVSSYEYHWMNPWWAHEVNEKGEPNAIFGDFIKGKGSQDLPKLYCPTGAIWIANSEALKKHKTFYGPGHVFYELDWKSSVDIDDYEDLQLAEAMYKMKMNISKGKYE